MTTPPPNYPPPAENPEGRAGYASPYQPPDPGMYPQASAYPAPPPYYAGAPQGQRPSGGFAVAALILGLLAILFAVSIVGGILFGLIAVILGFVGVNKANRGTGTRKGMALTGAILGLVGLVLSAIMIFYVVWLWNEAGIGDYLDCVNDAPNRSAEQVCDDELDDRLNDVYGWAPGTQPAGGAGVASAYWNP